MPDICNHMQHDQAFDSLSAWIERQRLHQTGSDFQLTDFALNLLVVVHFNDTQAARSIEAWGNRVSIMHLSCFTTNPVPIDQQTRITLTLPGGTTLQLHGRIVFCSPCLNNLYRTGVMFDWESPPTQDDLPTRNNN